jgi:membrane associated rhomboid family serine protease
MQAPGFSSAPLTRLFLFTLLLTSLLATLLSSKPLFHLQILPHLLQQHQFYRLLTFQSIYANSGELLFSTLLLYHLRLLERLFGSRKFLSCIVYSGAATSVLAPAVLLLGWWLTGGRWNYLPPGPTPVLFALLAQYHAAVPGTYKFALLLPGGVGELVASDKIYAYLLALQLAACQLPGSAVGAALGWLVGYTWRLEMLPKTRWRVGRRVVRFLGGEAEGREYEALRSRLRGEVEREEGQQGPIVWRVLDQFRGR